MYFITDWLSLLLHCYFIYYWQTVNIITFLQLGQLLYLLLTALILLFAARASVFKLTINIIPSLQLGRLYLNLTINIITLLQLWRLYLYLWHSALLLYYSCGGREENGGTYLADRYQGSCHVLFISFLMCVFYLCYCYQFFFI